MASRTPSLNSNAGLAIDREIDSKYDDVKVVAKNIDAVVLLAENMEGIQSVQENTDLVIAKTAEAAASAASASDSEDMAHKWADNPEDSPVVGAIGVDDEYSAYHWAKKAESVVAGNIVLPLDGLSDVDAAGAVEGEMIRYSAGAGEWLRYNFNKNPKIGFDLNGSAVTEGQLAWNHAEGTLDLGLANGSVLQVGQEDVRTVRNGTLSTILNGTVVMFDGTIGASGKVKVKPYTATIGSESTLYGMATQDIVSNTDGLITISGKVRGLNTSGSTVGETWLDEDILYVKPDDSGRLTKYAPVVGVKIPIAVVINAHATNGTLEVRVLPYDENKSYTRAEYDTLYDILDTKIDTKQNTILDGGLPVTKLDIDGATDINADLADADLLIVDDGGVGVARKSAMSRVWTYILSKIIGAASTIVTTDLSANRVVISSTAGKVINSGVTTGELEVIASSSVATTTTLTDSMGVVISTPTMKKTFVSDIWAYVSSKLTGAVSTITTSNLNGNKVVVTTAGGKIDDSSITTTELEHLSGVTSSIQTQVNTKITRPVSSTNKIPKWSNTTGDLVDSNLYSSAMGDLGLNISPSLWHSSVRALETSGGAVFHYGTAAMKMVQNAYLGLDGIYRYKTNNPAVLYNQEGGEHRFSIAGSGATESTVAFSEKFKIGSDGIVSANGYEVFTKNTLGKSLGFAFLSQYTSITNGAVDIGAYLQNALNNNSTVYLDSSIDYYLNSTVTIPYGVSLERLSPSTDGSAITGIGKLKLGPNGLIRVNAFSKIHKLNIRKYLDASTPVPVTSLTGTCITAYTAGIPIMGVQITDNSITGFQIGVDVAAGGASSVNTRGSWRITGNRMDNNVGVNLGYCTDTMWIENNHDYPFLGSPIINGSWDTVNSGGVFRQAFINGANEYTDWCMVINNFVHSRRKMVEGYFAGKILGGGYDCEDYSTTGDSTTALNVGIDITVSETTRDITSIVDVDFNGGQMHGKFSFNNDNNGIALVNMVGCKHKRFRQGAIFAKDVNGNPGGGIVNINGMICSPSTNGGTPDYIFIANGYSKISSTGGIRMGSINGDLRDANATIQITGEMNL